MATVLQQKTIILEGVAFQAAVRDDDKIQLSMSDPNFGTVLLVTREQLDTLGAAFIAIARWERS